MLAAEYEIVIPSIPEAPLAWGAVGLGIVLVCASIVWLILRRKTH